MWAVCHEEGCPQEGTPVDVDDAARAVCGGCQHPAHLVDDAPKATRRKRHA